MGVFCLFFLVLSCLKGFRKVFKGWEVFLFFFSGVPKVPKVQRLFGLL